MLTFAFALIALGSIGLAMYGLLGRGNLTRQIELLKRRIAIRQEQTDAKIGELQAELAAVNPIRHIPNIINRAKRLEAETTSRLEEVRRQGEIILTLANADIELRQREAAARLEQARQRAAAVIRGAEHDAACRTAELTQDAERDRQVIRTARITAEAQAQQLIADAQAEVKQIAAAAREEAREKHHKVEETLDLAVKLAHEIRQQAETKAEAIGGQAYDALRQHNRYAAQALALKNRIEGYGDSYLVPAEHVLDDLAYDFGFHKSGERLKLARDRVKIMERNGTAATCQYPDGWKKDYAIKFVLDAFNGQVDAILSRIKPAYHGKLTQQIRDVFALTNRNGEVFRNARIEDEFLNARLEELKWGVAVKKLKDQDREEQKALKERIKEEEKEARERARAIEQAEREQALIAKAIEKARREYANAKAQDREGYEAKLRDLNSKLLEAELKNQKAISMAQQTKNGFVYIISNLGSFGSNVYKIGLTRRLEPLDRVRELSNASVPFSFDVHALIYSEDAPALETALHRRFRADQMNKVNRRKEFFRLDLKELRDALIEMKYEVRWSMAAEAQEYHDTLRMDDQMQGDPEFRRRWAESEAAYEAIHFDEDEDSTAGDLVETQSIKKARSSRRPRSAGKASARKVELDGSAVEST